MKSRYQVYIRPLETEFSNLLSKEELKLIFSNIEELFEISAKLLQQLLQESEKPMHLQRIGDIFWQFVRTPLPPSPLSPLLSSLIDYLSPLSPSLPPLGP